MRILLIEKLDEAEQMYNLQSSVIAIFLLCLYGQAFTKNTELKGARIYSRQFEKHIIIVKQYLQSNSSSKDECS